MSIPRSFYPPPPQGPSGQEPMYSYPGYNYPNYTIQQYPYPPRPQPQQISLSKSIGTSTEDLNPTIKDEPVVHTAYTP